MDVPRFRRGLVFFETLRQKLQRYRKRDILAQSATPKIKILRGGGTLIVSLLLAWLTHAAVGAQSVQDYLTKEWPNVEMWEGYLQRRGYQPVTDSSLQAKLLQQFVPIFGTEPAVFESEDSCLVYLESSPHLSGQSQLWSCNSKPERPRRWLRLGTGWSAFQKISKGAQIAPKLSKKLSNSVDPKEIRY